MGGHVRIQKWLKGLVDGGDHELGRDDLLRQVEEGILALRRHGSRGMEVFPPAVRVYVEAVEGSLETLRGFVKDPSFEKDLEARLNNRLIAADTLPARRYEVLRAERSGVRVEEDSKTNLAILLIEGGDKDGQRIALTYTEFSLLELLFREPGRVVPRAEILEQLWGYPPRRAADLRVVDVYVARLRGKLEPDPRNPELILTVRGTGYASQRMADAAMAAAG
jgi:hypothetical protein